MAELLSSFLSELDCNFDDDVAAGADIEFDVFVIPDVVVVDVFLDAEAFGVD